MHLHWSSTPLHLRLLVTSSTDWLDLGKECMPGNKLHSSFLLPQLTIISCQNPYQVLLLAFLPVALTPTPHIHMCVHTYIFIISYKWRYEGPERSFQRVELTMFLSHLIPIKSSPLLSESSPNSTHCLSGSAVSSCLPCPSSLILSSSLISGLAPLPHVHPRLVISFLVLLFNHIPFCIFHLTVTSTKADFLNILSSVPSTMPVT